MSRNHVSLLSEYREKLQQQRYNPVVVHNYCRNAEQFLSYLTGRKIGLKAVIPETVSQSLRLAARRFRVRHGRAPASKWISIPRSGIQGLLKLALRCWPPEPPATSAGEALCRDVCKEYEHVAPRRTRACRRFD